MAHLVVAGAGAAGLFSAGVALENGHRVTLIEHMPGPGAKLAITGKGRCNLTNGCDETTFLQGVRHNPKFLRSAIHALPPAAVMDLFENKLGVPLVTERGRRVFPQSGKAADVVAALRRYAKGAALVRGRAVRLLVNNGRAAGFALDDGRQVQGDAALVATGGLSYPKTGSTGLGYPMAATVGHTIVPPRPSLVALVAGEGCQAECRAMAGLSLCNVGLRLLLGEKTLFQEQGEVLFTHFGLSGPLTLSASAYVEDPEVRAYAISLDLKPALGAPTLDARIVRDFEAAAARTAAHALDKLLPASLRPVVLARWGAAPDMRVGQITRGQRQRLAALMKDFRIPVAGMGDFEHAVITGGGVDVKEVNPRTMESKLLPGLYFAGEVLDVDGYTGGYNLHIAWCSAWAVGRAL